MLLSVALYAENVGFKNRAWAHLSGRISWINDIVFRKSCIFKKRFASRKKYKFILLEIATYCTRIAPPSMYTKGFLRRRNLLLVRLSRPEAVVGVGVRAASKNLAFSLHVSGYS